MGVAHKMIKKMPSPLGKLYYKLIPFKYRYSPVFRNTYDFLLKSQGWSLRQHQEHQQSELNKLLEHAYQNTPYYRRVFDERGLKPKDIQTTSALKKLPFLTKTIIRKNFNDLIAQNIDRNSSIIFKTSGSTGEHLEFLGTDDMYKKEAAFILRAFNAHGASLYNRPSIWLRRYVPKANQSLSKPDHEMNRLYLSAYHLSTEHIHTYAQIINKSKIETLVTYPSAVYILACLLEEHQLKLPHLKHVHVASEKLLPEWKAKAENVLGIPVKAHYGQMEKVVLMHQTADSDNYVDNPEYGVTELIPENRQHLIVGTSFMNYIMPMIRYKTNDTAELYTGAQPKHGLPLAVRDIFGRCDDILVSETGHMLPGVNFYTMMYKVPGVKMFSLVQKNQQELDVMLVRGEHWAERSAQTLEQNLQERLGKIKINWNFVSDIPRSEQTGKIRCIRNQINGTTIQQAS